VNRLLAVALPALPEVQAGDDLAALTAAAWRELQTAEPELTPAPGDVLVVTQKVVSKAEGAVVDLRTVTPRPEAITFAERWDRDPRQVEVVLREAAEVVRMERGCSSRGPTTGSSAPTAASTPPTSPPTR